MNCQIQYGEVAKPVRIPFLVGFRCQVAFTYMYTVTANLACILRVILDLVNFEHDDYNEVRLKCHLHLSFSSLDSQTSLSPPVMLHVILWLDVGNL